MEKQAKENRENTTHELEDKNVMTKKVQNQFSPGLRMSYQKPSETAEASGGILQLRHTYVSYSAMTQ